MKRYLAGVLVLVIVAVLLFLLSNLEQSARSPAPPKKAEHSVESPIKSDEEVVFYPTMGWPVDESEESDWEIEIHGSIYERGNIGAGVAAAVLLLRQLTGLGDEQFDTDEARLFQQRAEAFAVDNEGGKQIPIRIGERIHTLPASNANGHFEARLRLSRADVIAASGGQFRELTFSAILPSGDRRDFSGTVHLVPQGSRLHVISDVDDTIKISEVRDRSALLKNTFCRPFQPVPGMAELYQSWAADDVHFHYISASPWQLFAPLSEFIREHNFPQGTFHMKLFRIKDRTAMNLLGSQEHYKRNLIEPLLKRFPNDQFVLVGDSGEQDAKIYAELARDYPRQVRFIFIRNVTDEPLDKFRETFAGIAPDRWEVFQESAEIATPLRVRQ